MNVVPRPGSLSTSISPPMRWQSLRVIARPRPVPPYFLVVPASAWPNASKRRAVCSGVMPIPVSATRKKTQLPATPTSRRTSSVTSPSLVNLAAFDSRFRSTWRTFVTSSRIEPRSSGQRHFEAVAVLLDERPGGDGGLVDDGPDLECLEIQPHLAGLDLGEVEDVVDEPEQVLAGGLDLLEVGDDVGMARGRRVLREHLAVAEDRVQRRAQLVAHVGEERALRLAGLLGGLVGLEGRLQGALDDGVLLLDPLVLGGELLLGARASGGSGRGTGSRRSP